MDCKTLANVLEEIGNLLELTGENPFKAISYYNAARLFREEDVDLDKLVESDRLLLLPGIGDALAKKITELVRTDRLGYYNRIRESIPADLITIMKIPGIGPRRAYTIHKKLGIVTVDELWRACQDGRLISLKGFYEKNVRSISDHIEKMRGS